MVLPQNVIAGYQNWGACNATETITSVESGVNVILWFSINLAGSAAGVPNIVGGPDYSCVKEVADELEQRGLETTHLITIGGWDAPHPNETWTGGEWFAVWDEWNNALPRPFDGFDWDLEGNDALDSPFNTFTEATLNIVVDMSVAAKASGKLVTMVPAQSYLDPTTSEFSQSLLNAYSDWHPTFTYHGLNSYAYFLVASPPNTFDLVSVQLYESWSRADQAILQSGDPPGTYLAEWSEAITSGFTVDFGDSLARVKGEATVLIDPTQLIVALSRGDAAGKSAFFWPEACGEAYNAVPASRRPRGYAFW
jgi:hypothetical protein